MMTAEEKAKCGLWLLKEAVLQYLEKRPQGVRGDEIREALGLNLDWDSKKQHKYHLFWGLFNLLVSEGKVEKLDGNIVRASQPEARA